MSKFNLSVEEGLHLRVSIMLPNKRSLYEYLCELPIDKLQAYPKKGFHFWMGKAARSSQALAMRDYVLYWRAYKLIFQLHYPQKFLETLSKEELQDFYNAYMHKVPLWAYEQPLQDVTRILFHMA